jgi:NaMN:DMB phosphoribosyltransferase
MLLGAQLAFGKDRIVIGESVPGGTTTAYLLLRALGFNGMVSSAGPENPIDLKEQAWRDVSARLKEEGIGPDADPLELASQVGDPMQIVVAGLVAGIPGGVDITLAGGTQMLAVAALLSKLKVQRAPRVATTCYVSRDENAHFSDLAMAIGVRTWSAPLNFSGSAFTGLSDYERGFVKEGVGAGGSVWYAGQLGVPVEKVIARVESLYAEMTGRKASDRG